MYLVPSPLVSISMSSRQSGQTKPRFLRLHNTAG